MCETLPVYLLFEQRTGSLEKERAEITERK